MTDSTTHLADLLSTTDEIEITTARGGGSPRPGCRSGSSLVFGPNTQRGRHHPARRLCDRPSGGAPIDAVSVTLLRYQLHLVLATLAPREASIIALRFGLTEVNPALWSRSAVFTGSPGNVSAKSKPTALVTLRHRFRSQPLRSYLT